MARCVYFDGRPKGEAARDALRRKVSPSGGERQGWMMTPPIAWAHQVARSERRSAAGDHREEPPAELRRVTLLTMIATWDAGCTGMTSRSREQRRPGRYMPSGSSITNQGELSGGDMWDARKWPCGWAEQVGYTPISQLDHRFQVLRPGYASGDGLVS